MGLLCPNFLPNTCFFPSKQSFNSLKFLRFNLTNHANRIMKFNNGYLPFFFFCWALLYSPLAVWYAFEQRENLNTVNEKVGYNLKRHEAGGIDCSSCTYILFGCTMGHNNKGHSFGNTTIPFFVFYKPNQCSAYGPK